MNNTFSYRVQRGATLVVGLIILVVITILTISGFTLSGGNLQVVGNMQHRQEALAAAQVGIEQIINVNFATANPANYPAVVNVDITRNNVTDYVVSVNAPVCIKSVPAPANPETSSGVNANVPNITDQFTLWEIEASAQDQSSGAAIVVKQGVKKRLSNAEFLLSTC